MVELDCSTGIEKGVLFANDTLNVVDAQYSKKKGKITGKVVDTNGLSLPGVNIKVVELNYGVQSDIDGNYILELDKIRKTTQKQGDDLKAESNSCAKQIGDLMKSGKKEEGEALKIKMYQ